MEYWNDGIIEKQLRVSGHEYQDKGCSVLGVGSKLKDKGTRLGDVVKNRVKRI